MAGEQSGDVARNTGGTVVGGIRWKLADEGFRGWTQMPGREAAVCERWPRGVPGSGVIPSAPPPRCSRGGGKHLRRLAPAGVARGGQVLLLRGVKPEARMP